MQGRHAPYHPVLREQTPSPETEKTGHGNCGEGNKPLPQNGNGPMFFAKVGLSYPIRS